MTLADLEQAMAACPIVNIHRGESGFRVSVRRSLELGFEVAQRDHPSLGDALLEHFAPEDEDLLI